ncbi:LysR family transcriptional regulator [Aquabacterium sp. J223]|uniref:LysR family transcriptional regulator n=1 Tax=Aquabacterium sp. J223 TaxID=2898431 RepID=UPI0021AD64AC|nr:LysR family transcriptional regulator [Aquabacterium sp. J223]UUX95297.1 LysR family transcriptional regulator [Aquabacterium sp. J223]
MANIRDVDLNLLTVLDQLVAQRSVTRAAAALGMSQPAVSAALQRLRTQIGDALFVRTRHGMAPTPRALALHEQVRAGLQLLRTGLEGVSSFDPATSRREFRLLLSDVGQVLYLPALMVELHDTAPHVTLTAVTLPRDRYRDALEAGDVDLAVGHLPQLGDAFFQQRLLEDRFVGLARAEHPRVGRSLTLARFVAESHVAVVPVGPSPNALEQTLRALKIQRRVSLAVPNFLAAPLIVRGTELLACVPHRVIRAMPTVSGLRVMALPFATPALQVNQFWHRRQHLDDGHRWLRGVIAKVMSPPGTGDYVDRDAG